MSKPSDRPYQNLILRICLLYTLAGTLWILITDRLLNAVLLGKELVTQMQTVKGLVYVAATCLSLYFLMRREMRGREMAEEELKRLCYKDGLTGIANRRHFEEVLEREWRRAARNRKPLSLLMCDIDFFKAYNDTYGHQSGDECLKQVAGALNGMVNRPGDLVSRYGGEEFAVILPETDAEGAAFVAETLRAGIEALKIPNINSGLGRYLTVSLGVASLVPSPDSSSDELIAAADHALYQAKVEGRNRVKIFRKNQRGISGTRHLTY